MAIPAMLHVGLPKGDSSRFTVHHAISVVIMVPALATLSAKWPR